MFIVCPKPDALTEIPDNGCPVDWDQVIKLVFQRTGQAPLTLVTIKTLAAWTPLLAADDDTKVVPTPVFAELEFPQSAPLTQGGNDNTTVGGIPIYNGEGFVEVSAQIPGLNSAVKLSMKPLTAESVANSLGKSGLGFYAINRFGQIIARQVDATHIYPFDCYNFRIGSTGSKGFNDRNKNQIGMSLMGDWDDYAALITPSFDALAGIVTP